MSTFDRNNFCFFKPKTKLSSSIQAYNIVCEIVRFALTKDVVNNIYNNIHTLKNYSNQKMLKIHLNGY